MSDVIVYLAGVEWDAVKGTDRHLVERIGRHHRVVWVDPPLSAAHAVRRRRWDRLRHPVEVSEASTGVTRISVLTTPFTQRAGVDRITSLWMRRAVHVALRRGGCVVRGVVGSTPFASLGTAPRPVGGHRVYYATDDFVAGAALLGHPVSRLGRAERRRLAEADVVAAVTPEILRRWGRGATGTVLPNGCDPETFADVDSAAAAPGLELPAPVAGVVGQLSSRIDLGLLEAVAARGMSLLLVGPVTDDTDRDRFDALVRCANVAWVGPQPFEELPSFLRLVDVGLTPYADTPFNRASFPLKTLEYLAAGRAVVSTPLPAVQALGTHLVEVAADPDEFAAKALVAASGEDAASRSERRRFAAAHSWETRAAEMLDLAVSRPGPTSADRTARGPVAVADGSAAAD